MDYGVGNLYSISKGIERAGAQVRVISDPQDLLSSECIVFPGVGAFGAAMDTLKPVLAQLRERIVSGVPAIGVCLGMQILFERSEESPGEGVAILKGDVVRLKGPRVPQMGWNEVVPSRDALFEDIPDMTQFYFANSYICRPTESVEIAESEYGQRFPSAVRKGNTYGVQFHPEKSGSPGLRLLGNFVRLAEESA